MMSKASYLFLIISAIYSLSASVARGSEDCLSQLPLLEMKPVEAPVGDGVYVLQQASILFGLPDGQQVGLHYLTTPDGSMVGSIQCPLDGISDTGPNMKVVTEAVIETLVVQQGDLFIVNGTRLWDLVLLVIDDELHLQDSRTSLLDLGREGLSPDALQSIQGLEYYLTPGGLVVRYMNVVLLYKKID